MKKGQIYEGYVEWLDFPNKGLVRCDGDGEIAVVKNVLPGQRVSFRVNKKRGSRAEGRLIEVLERAPYEKDSICPHFGECGGCAYQNVPYEKQLEIKKAQVRKLLYPVLERQRLLDGADTMADEYAEDTAEYIDKIFEGIKASPVQFEYRNKMEFSFGDEYKEGPLALGMHKRGSFYDIVSVRECRLVDEDYRKILACVLDYFSSVGAPYFHKINHMGYLRHLLVRKAQKTGEILIAIVTSTQGEYDLKTLTQKLLGLPFKGKITGVLHTLNDSLADVVQSDRTEILFGKDYFYEELLGLKFRISQFSFFQTNTMGAEVLYQTARDFLGDISGDGQNKKTIFDLYSGTGTIAQLLAPVAGKVIGVELVEEAVKAARENAELNGLSNCEFIAGDVLKVIDDIEVKPDFIVLDPPRDGIHPKALRKIIDYQVEKLVYISCKPTSLARDLEVFIDSGYRVERAVAVDQFAGTGHVETVVQLYHQKSTEYFHVDYEPKNGDYLDKMPATATYREIKQWVYDNYNGMKVSSLYVAQIKQKYGIIERECYNKRKLENARVPQCPSDKKAAIEAALKHFKMI